MIGQLKHRVQLMAPVEVEDAAGGRSLSLTSMGFVWAAVEPTAPQTITDTGRDLSQTQYEITIRHRADVAPGWRVRLAGQDLYIEAVTPVDLSNRYLRLSC